jgi:hypothetical protein
LASFFVLHSACTSAARNGENGFDWGRPGVQQAKQKRRRQSKKQKHLESSLVPGTADAKKKSRPPPNIPHHVPAQTSSHRKLCSQHAAHHFQFLSVAQQSPRRTELGLGKV